MSKAYKIIARRIPAGDRKGDTVYGVRPVSYGLLSTNEVAKQISTESTATPADVKAVLDRYAYYVKENLKKGYDVELLGFGTLSIRFVTSCCVDDPKLATAKLVNSLLPAFRPSYRIHNGKRIYDLIPDKISLVNYVESTEEQDPENPAVPDDTPSGGDTPGGSNTPSGSGEGNDSDFV